MAAVVLLTAVSLSFPTGAAQLPSDPVEAFVPATAVAAGHSHGCVLLVTDNVKCWGSGTAAQGYTGGDAIDVAAGGYHSCALLEAGDVECWGSNSYGQAVDRRLGDAVAISGGYYHTCAVTTAKNVQCWGENGEGQSAPYTGGDAVMVSAGYLHTCVLTESRNVHCWGRSSEAGSYTGGDALDMAAGGHHTCVLRTNGNVVCWGFNWHGESDPYNGGDAVAIAAGHYATCVILQNGNLRCWGWLSSVDYAEDVVQVSISDINRCVLFANGNAQCGSSKGHQNQLPVSTAPTSETTDNTVYAGGQSALRVTGSAFLRPVAAYELLAARDYADGQVTAWNTAVESAKAGNFLPLINLVLGVTDTQPPIYTPMLYGPDGLLHAGADVDEQAPPRDNCYGAENHQGALSQPLLICSQFLP